MQKRIAFALTLLLAIFIRSEAPASSTIPLSPQDHLRSAVAVLRGTVLEVHSYRDPTDRFIYTLTLVRVDEPIKGTFPTVIKLVHRGGVADNEGEMDGFSPQFQVGEERLLFLARRTDGSLFALQGGPSALKLKRIQASRPAGTKGRPVFAAPHQGVIDELRIRSAGGVLPGDDVRDQAATVSADASGPAAISGPPSSASASAVTGLLVDTNGISSRFLQPDRGEPIPYLVDVAYLPAGMTTNQALIALTNALAAWTAVTGVRFTFDGFTNFPTAAADVTTPDGKLRLQLHDNFNYITNLGVLAKGGRGFFTNRLTAGWSTGGNVAGNEFHQTTRGYVVLKHTNSLMQNTNTFAEVLCHEIGHTLSMAHTTADTPAPTNSPLYQSIMYYVAHADNRGARLGDYDPPVVQQVHPTNNTPPWTYDRVMDIVTIPFMPPDLPGVNRIELRGYDLQTTNLNVATTDGYAPDGTFTLNGSIMRFDPNNFYNSPRLDPAIDAPYDLLYARCSDGTNASPYVQIRVISLGADRYPIVGPTIGDGLPDDWMSAYFGNPDPGAGANRGPNDDFDGDGLTNFQEFLSGTNPTNPFSNLRITAFTRTNLQFTCRPYDLYEVQRSSDLVQWTRMLNPILATSTNAVMSGLPVTNGQQYYRVLRVP